MARQTARERIMDAVVRCVDRSGLHSFALEDVAGEAEVSRATIYRHFPGGRQQLVDETVAREVANFWKELSDEVRPLDGLEQRLVVGVMSAHRRLKNHDLLQRLVTSEPGDIMGPLLSADRSLQALVIGYLRELLARERLREGIELDHAAWYLSRMLLSHIGSAGRWDLADEASVTRLVRTQFLGGILDSRPSDV